jgi:sialic acid synthase SpsE
MNANNTIITKFNKISSSSPTYFVADIAANHDGSLKRALELVKIAADNGANAAKFQNFKAETIVSRKGFIELGKKLSHQAKWDKDVVDVYKAAELPLEWTESLVKECESNSIDYFTAPYDLEYIKNLDQYVPFFKIGSGDITWKESIQLMIDMGKPILLATGASEMWEVRRAVELLEKSSHPYVLMQCNTNYTGDESNFDNLNLRVISTFSEEFPDCILGLSDHSRGHISVLGAVTLGARVIEKHFTDDTFRAGPDHAFSLDPIEWNKMVTSTRILERCLGDGIKRVEKNETESRIVQRRGLRYTRDLPEGTFLGKNDLIAVRPSPENGIDPWEMERIIGQKINIEIKSDDLVQDTHFL